MTWHVLAIWWKSLANRPQSIARTVCRVFLSSFSSLVRKHMFTYLFFSLNRRLSEFHQRPAHHSMSKSNIHRICQLSYKCRKLIILFPSNLMVSWVFLLLKVALAVVFSKFNEKDSFLRYYFFFSTCCEYSHRFQCQGNSVKWFTEEEVINLPIFDFLNCAVLTS
jgi:hypothetical protein